MITTLKQFDETFKGLNIEINVSILLLGKSNITDILSLH